MKKIKQRLSILLILFSFSLLVSCGGDGIGGTGNPHQGVSDAQTSITQISVPFREHGYSNVETFIIHSQSKFDTFMSAVKGQSNWNDKTDFLQKIQAQTYDFTKENIILYRITESSGSVSLSPQTPTLKNNEVTIKIKRQVPQVGTTDMAYYLLAYKVNKEITKLIFDYGSSQVEVSTPQAQGKLVRTDDTKLLRYFQKAIKQAKENNTKDGSFELSTTADAGSGSSSESSNVSSTNIQEVGVDEADLIKTNGRYIFSVKKGDAIKQAINETKESFAPEKTDVPSDIIRIMDTQDTSGITEVKRISDEDKPWSISGLYLYGSASSTNKRLIALSSKKQQYWDHWFKSSYFSNQNTDVLFIDVNDPKTATVTTKLSFEGRLIDSRRNGDVLYLVLRHYSDYQYIDDTKLSSTTNKTFLPSYQIESSNNAEDKSKQLITKAENCYLEKGQEGSADVITLIAVDLKSSTPQVSSQCFVGSAETIYASQKALYLATTRWDYQKSNGVANYARQVSTDIHKFSYDGLNFDYRGSGEVDGHLGHRQNSKSFRFSENDGLLRVVTYDEDMWGGPITALPIELTASDSTSSGSDSTAKKIAKKSEAKSPVLLNILKEDSSNKTLQLVSKLPNTKRPTPIGLPGEQLYASRFIGNRAYIITFRVTDPLYVLDLSDSTDPKIAGELKIDGYSEYLHPISETLLLGIGKDAIAAEAGGFGDGRGAWYQGLKLSLIDVTDPSNPQEADKIILGKRGTESTALSTHHAVTSLTVDNQYRVAIPVNIHSETPTYQSSSEASTYYNYSHTGLYRFEIDINNQKISKIPAMIVEDFQGKTSRDIFTDRSVLINDNVFYMHKGDFWTQDWQGENAMIGPK